MSVVVADFFTQIKVVACFGVNLSLAPVVESSFEPPHDKTNKMACAPNEDTDQPVHLVGS